MYIPEIECPNCGKKGRVGVSPFGFSLQDKRSHCPCGTSFKIKMVKDQMVLSPNPFTRLEGLSNYSEKGHVYALPGDMIQVSFKRPIDVIAQIFLSPHGTPIRPVETNLTQTGFAIVCAREADVEYTEKVMVGWRAYGLTDVDRLPAWYMQFYSAVSNSQSSLYKAALFDYAVSFEAFVEEHLTNIISKKHSPEVAAYVMAQTWKVSDRVTKLALFATGKRLSDHSAVYAAWCKHVQGIRNELFHGGEIKIDRKMAEAAHHAVYQAIRYMQDVVV